jgi:hypothetical protein
MTRTPWSDAERATLKRSLRYALTIFIAIGITLLIVGVLSSMLPG